ncbi:hypothetical protein [Streptomyces sp. NBC_01538]|uniref:hypothetical protein n=1 Tax=Streptomyces sp. NBC_01538 TaxID=2903897 RepID=UPI00386BB916
MSAGAADGVGAAELFDGALGDVDGGVHVAEHQALAAWPVNGTEGRHGHLTRGGSGGGVT